MTVLQKLNRLRLELPVQSWLFLFILISIPLKHIINSLFIIGFAIFTVAHYIKHKKLSNGNRLVIVAFISLYIWMIASTIWSINLENTTNALTQFLSFLVLPIAFYFTEKSTINVKKILTYFSLTMGVYAIFALIIGTIRFFYYLDSGYLFYHTLSSPFDQINAIYFSLLISFAIIFLCFESSKSLLKNATIFILGGFLLLLSSKSIVIITGLILLLRLFQVIRVKRKEILRYSIILVVLMLILFIFSRNIRDRIIFEVDKTSFKQVIQEEQFGQVYHWTGSGLRVFQLRMFYELLDEDEKYLLGYGLQSSQEKLIEKYKKYDLYPGFYGYNFHNQYAQITIELGVIGLILILIIIFRSMGIAYANNNFIFLSFIILMSIVFFTESVLWRQRGMVFFISIVLLFTQITISPKKVVE